MHEDFIPPLPHPDSDKAYWRAGSWEAYHRTLAHHAEPGRAKEDEGAYLPDPDEIDVQIGKMRWLESLGFNDLFISSVMIYDAPTFERVCQMIDRHGPTETYRRCRPFLTQQ